MKLEFLKMSGAGNDFIMIDNLKSNYVELLTPDLIKQLCARGISVGADGLIEIRPANNSNLFSMKYYNNDGIIADMCGNGGRCIAAFALHIGLARLGEEFFFDSDAGLHKAIVNKNGSVRLWMTNPVISFIDKEIRTSDSPDLLRVSLVNTGVPHAVLFTNESLDGKFEHFSPLLRRHSEFGSAGANVDFARIEDIHNISIRTFERGVEAETLACGTGAVASAICGVELKTLQFPVRVKVKSGCTLIVGLDDFGYWLEGDARVVYSGIIE